MTNNLISIPSSDFRFSGIVDYDYDNDSSGCHCEDYCRCSRIVNQRITNIDFESLAWEFFSSTGKKKGKKNPGDPTSVELYLVERMLHRLVSKGDFYLSTCSGWYGEEVSGVRFNASDSLYDAVKCYNSAKTLTEKVFLVLQLEYGSVLPELEDVSDWEILTVPLKCVSAFEGHMKHVNTSTVLDYTASLTKDSVVALCLPSDDHWRLIDGRHRFTAATNKGFKNVNIMVPSNSKVETKKSRKKPSKEDLRKSGLAKLTVAEKEALGLL